ncbi:hypothetical protein ANCCEY_14334 [Ancylostoma ceylanicum]|uniref:Uncharacterized protein n=1 Tax=Ancylostoma ceylanicum TaxID=53326 RepID=A0A0D6L6S5_9BILA|nr:hypothetical protein ANCCEY_14334 [Ancylostoma ceylanicum]
MICYGMWWLALFSFDGLTPGTWFAFRIHYQLHYENSKEPKHDLKTKQEIIVRTKESQHEDPTKINDSIAYIDDLFLTKDNIYIGVASVFKDTKKVITVIVPELRCSKGVLKPLAQQIMEILQPFLDESEDVDEPSGAFTWMFLTNRSDFDAC